jgi:hypothetical protein
MMTALVTLPAPQAAAAPITITYEVRGKGNATSLEDFATRATQTFADNRGWGLGGSIQFVRVPDGGQFTLWLSAARYLPAFSSGCSTLYSCRVGRNVIINETPFRQATPAWRATGASLRDYQHMVVNHETGHWLGFGHLYCPGSGQPAPVMQQQSKGMQGCLPNAWPTATERSTLSRWRSVPILLPGMPLDQARALVRSGYLDVLGRAADAGGLETWAAALHGGRLSRSGFMTALIRSAEGSNRIVTAMYRDILGRDPDPGGRSSWAGALSRGMPRLDVRATLWGSRERLQRSPSLQAWVDDLYLVELGRPADPAGRAHWLATADRYGARAAAAGIMGSAEWSNRTVAGLYQQMLHRPADASGLAHWSRVLRSRGVTSVQSALGASSEYLKRATASA